MSEFFDIKEYYESRLGLPEFRVIDVCEEPEDRNLIISVEPRNKDFVRCKVCGYTTNKNGPYFRHLQDIPLIPGERTILHIYSHMYICKNPNKETPHSIFVLDYDCAAEQHQFTHRMETLLLEEALSKTLLTDICNKYGISAGKLNTVIEDGVAELDKNRIIEAPEHLGLDETQIDGEFRLVAVDTAKGDGPARLIEIYPARLKGDVIAFLKSLANKERLKTVTIDMWKGYSNAVSECFDTSEGKVRVILDRYHVMSKLLEKVEAVRKNLCALIEQRAHTDPDLKEVMKACKFKDLNHFWFKMSRDKLAKNHDSYRRFAAIIAAFPELGELYKIKEDFYDLYEYSPDKEKAMAAFDDWAASIPRGRAYSPLKAFKDAIKNKWYDEFFNYFVDPIGERYSNGPVEALNRTIKTIVGDGYGYSFNVLRAKIIYGNRRFPKTYFSTRRPLPAKGKSSFKTSCMAFISGEDTPEIREDIFTILGRDDVPDLDYVRTVTEGWSQDDIIELLKEGGHMDAICSGAEVLDQIRDSFIFEPVALSELEADAPALHALMAADMALGYTRDTEPPATNLQ